MPAARKTYRRRRTPARRTSRRSYRRRAPTRRRRSMRRKPMAISKFTLAQLDPFSEKVAGVKIPDVNTQPSATVVAEDEWAITTGGTYGTQAAVFRPTLNSNIVNGTTSSSTVWSWTAGYAGASQSSKYLGIYNNNSLIRICAHGIRLTSALAPTSVTGYVHIAIVVHSNFSASTWDYPISIEQMQTSQWYKRIPLAVLTQKPYKVVNKILDSNGFRYFDPQSDLISSATDVELQSAGWADIMVAVSGVPLNTNAISVESIVHYETIPSNGSALTTSPAAPASSASVEQATNVANATPAVHEEGMFGNFFAGAAEAVGDIGRAAYGSVNNRMRDYGYNVAMGLGAYGYNWLQTGGANYRAIQY